MVFRALNNVQFCFFLAKNNFETNYLFYYPLFQKTHLEKKGTFTNKHGITQENKPVIPPIAGKDECTIWFEIAQACKNFLSKDSDFKKDESFIAEFIK